MIDWDTIVEQRLFHDLLDDGDVILMSFTGIIDINGVEVYDRDIVVATLIAADGTIFEDETGMVTYGEYEWELVMDYSKWPVASWGVVENCKVINNVFENEILLSILMNNIGLT